MNLLPKSIEKQLPELYATERNPDPIAYVKFFTPDSGWTWYATEYDPETRTFFGLVSGFEVELGYFTLDELKSVRGSLGLPVERDLYWKPRRLSEIRSGRYS